MELFLALLVAFAGKALAGSGCTCPQSYYAGASGTIQSPNYPNNYCGITCSYEIQVFNGQMVQLTFSDCITEQGYDFITIYDGKKTDDNANKLANFSGSCSNKVFYSGGTTLSVKFSPDGNQFHRGFSANWVAVTNICGSPSYSGTTGTFTSPNWPSNYPNNVNCRWVINVPSNKVVNLSFNSNARTELNDDVVSVAGSNGAPLAQMSGAGFHTVQSTGNVMTVTFTSDYDVIFPGFQATYTAVNPPQNCDCGQTTRYTNQPATLTSPNYPLPYCRYHNCTWYLRVDNAYNVQITWNSFDVERNYDYVFVYSGLGTGGTLLEQCTGNSCSTVTSNTNWMTVQFTSDGSVQGNGFKATWQPVLARPEEKA
jgi:cubilin